MALTIADATMTSDRSAHTAVLLPGARHTWVVSWLPGRHLDHRKAVTAMTIADTTADGGIRPDNEEWRRIESWAAELHLTGSDALDRVAAPPQWDNHPKSILEFGEVNGIRLVLEDPDPIDLGIADEYFDDWPEPPDFEGTKDAPIDLTWTGKEPPGAGPLYPAPPPPESEDRNASDRSQADSDLWRHVPRQRGVAYIPLQSPSWLDDRAPHQAVNPRNADRSLLPGPEPDKQEQPDWEPGNEPAREPYSEPDWEAGQ